MTKDEILDALEGERQAFLEAIDDLPPEALEEPGVVGSWSIKDIISHISRWEAEMVKLLWQLEQGAKPSTAHFTQKDADTTNEAWYKEARQRELDKVLGDFQAVRKQTTRRVAGFSIKDLNDPHRFPALAQRDNRPLWEWIASDSFEHDQEHLEQVLDWRERKGF